MSIEARFKLDFSGFNLDVDLTLPGRGITALFGHSGSGKTTLLRCLAGLERAPDGYLALDGKVWQQGSLFVPTHHRSLGYVFQEASLFPHLNVRRNLEYGMSRIADGARRVSLDSAIELLGIGHLLERMPDRLSGGERSRVAIARALAVSPRILLMDEPLAALDLARKQEILPYLERLHDELEIPVVYVSHSPDEVARLADTMVLMEGGKIVASGPIHEMLTRLDLPLAHGDEAGVVIDTIVGEHDETYHLTRLDFAGGSIIVARQPHALEHRMRLRIHARDVSLALERHVDSSILNILPAKVLEIADETPAHVVVRLNAGGVPLLARITRKSSALLGLKPGMAVFAQVKSVALLE
ncbi:MAG: molybdenum ABC transporter ATP-binding protein [Betaproteobacteria bacterium CG2_30_59_46]|nr:MAG: molybdenum ABC transporter ATP-binding protein [Betaproteobacteria bacterium CG2_30_59_46]PIQ13221.1 MAG: molybdenum ABC transporter ATP-binding protein [Hydrogenophilales bacterium CG18_big_fil_WC_8_21_14_2_50_58_12]PIY00721.1 MAG: molybdenum ABC transporter ATP-binding protein [Hydrogenophilales bacterium CG_4_10_14_3_um_filter_58_23]PJB06717.1 MAG: molybdenum ABC transporter ATP-binding protein [Hydrogenophilales bacterium CG_4_9_14_3_um_filter_59_35]